MPAVERRSLGRLSQDSSPLRRPDSKTASRVNWTNHQQVDARSEHFLRASLRLLVPSPPAGEESTYTGLPPPVSAPSMPILTASTTYSPFALSGYSAQYRPWDLGTFRGLPRRGSSTVTGFRPSCRCKLPALGRTILPTSGISSPLRSVAADFRRGPIPSWHSHFFRVFTPPPPSENVTSTTFPPRPWNAEAEAKTNCLSRCRSPKLLQRPCWEGLWANHPS